MAYYLENIEEQRALADETLKELLKIKHRVDSLVFDPEDFSLMEEFESYFIELNKLGLS